MSYPDLLPALTPQKPLPGAYFQTPAPSSSVAVPSFSIKATAAPAEQPASPDALPRLPPTTFKPKSQALSTEERAAGTVNDTLAQEARYPDLDSYLSRKYIPFAVYDETGLTSLCRRLLVRL